MANGAVVERLAEACVGYRCTGVAEGRIIRVQGVEDVMRDRLEIFLNIPKGAKAGGTLVPQALIGGEGQVVRRGDSGMVSIGGIKEDMLLTIQQVRRGRGACVGCPFWRVSICGIWICPSHGVSLDLI